MEITGKLISILNAQRFTSKRDGSEIVKNFFIIETQGQYPKKICFSVMGEDKFKQMNLVEGKTYNVSFDIESREWQNKWFTEASAWRAICVDGQQPTQAPQTQQPQTQAPETKIPPFPVASQSDNADDLPF